MFIVVRTLAHTHFVTHSSFERKNYAERRGERGGERERDNRQTDRQREEREREMKWHSRNDQKYNQKLTGTEQFELRDTTTQKGGRVHFSKHRLHIFNKEFINK